MLFVTYIVIFLLVRFYNLFKHVPLTTPQGLIKGQHKIIISKNICCQVNFVYPPPPHSNWENTFHPLIFLLSFLIIVV